MTESSIPQSSFYFLRHGQTMWNVEGRFQGHTDIPLNEVGLSQARDAATVLARCPVDLIIASPLIRARRTAEIVAVHLGKPLLLDDELKERHFGAFEGLVVNEVKAQFALQPHERRPTPSSGTKPAPGRFASSANGSTGIRTRRCCSWRTPVCSTACMRRSSGRAWRLNTCPIIGTTMGTPGVVTPYDCDRSSSPT